MHLSAVDCGHWNLQQTAKLLSKFSLPVTAQASEDEHKRHLPLHTEMRGNDLNELFGSSVLANDGLWNFEKCSVVESMSNLHSSTLRDAHLRCLVQEVSDRQSESLYKHLKVESSTISDFGHRHCYSLVKYQQVLPDILPTCHLE
jgi:hypothetical protein